MKIKAIAACCAKAKQLVIYDADGKQFAGDGVAAYLLPEAFGEVSTAALLAMFDIPAEKAADMVTKRMDLPESYSAEDYADGETDLIFEERNRIIHAGWDMVPLSTRDGRTYFIQTKYLKPIADAEGLQLSLRRSRGRPYIAAKDGMFLTAIISPMEPRENLLEWLNSIKNGAVEAHFRGGTIEDEHADV